MAEPERLYRPAWFLRLFVRLEDFGRADTGDGQDGSKPYKPPTADRQAKRNAIETQAAEQAAGAAGAGVRSKAAMVDLRSQSAKLARAEKASASKSTTSAGDSAEGDEYSVEFITVPSEMKIQDKGFRTAAEMTASFSFQDLPLDPRIIRECRVEGWVGTVTGEDFATPDKWHLQPGMSETSVLRFHGYVDVPEMEHDDEDGVVSIKARSYESVLIDGKINPRASAYRIVDKSGRERLTTYINRILSQYPPTAGAGQNGRTRGAPFRAYWYAADPAKEPYIDRKTLLRTLQTAKSQNEANGQTNPAVEPVALEQPAAEAPDPTGQGDTSVGGAPGMPPKSVQEDGMSIWDLITQVCELCGCMPVYQPSLPKGPGSQDGRVTTVDPANALLIVPPQAFLDDISRARQIQGGARDGFQRQFADGPSDVRFMIWGHNVSKMKLSRKLGKVRPSAVEVRAYNPDADAHLRVMSSRFPKHGKGGAKGKSISQGTEKGGGKIDVVRTFVLKGIRSQAALDQAAVSIYHQLTRAELTIDLETDELASYIDPVASQQAGKLVSHNGNPDLLKLCAGSPVHVTVAQRSKDESANIIVSSLTDFYGGQVHDILGLLTRQNDRWGAWRRDGSQDAPKIAETARRIQAAYEAAKLPDVFYCRAVTLNFSADSGFTANMELASYMNSNDPSAFTDDDKAKNNERKLKKHGAAKRTQARDATTAKIVENAERGPRK